jgi:hypothetical protein
MSGEFSPRSFRPGGMREFTVSKLSPPLNSMEPFPSAFTAVLVFPLIPKPASCLQRVRLRLRSLAPGDPGPSWPSIRRRSSPWPRADALTGSHWRR